MAEAKFEKIKPSDKLLYGPQKLLLCGFSTVAQSKFNAVLKMVGLSNIPKIWVSENQSRTVLSDLLKLPDGEGEGESSQLPRAIIVSGIMEKELISLMRVSKKTGMKNTLWATLTPTSENWTIQQLLVELLSERKAMQRKKKT
ncbi:MAG: hypothetical protein SRB2_00491 [Desulfobacteraceae bacterium Eth-SRB2]|nr:MAG: hypothetical protein SRB2_00491 [Desulfobacteraceae bacterium Eth-SRB2]